jgi:CheY-like chemotaxis protein
MKVLIVEDNPINAEMVRLALEKEHYEPIIAHDGEEGLAQLEAHPDVALVITDVMMPTVNGLEMLTRIRRRPEWQTLPVILATSLADEATVRQAARLHCKHFIVKPFTVRLLLQSVHDAIEQRDAILQDKTQVMARIGIDADGYQRLALAFASFVHDCVASFGGLCEREQLAELDATIRRDLVALEENATLLGAERIANLLVILGLPGGTPPADKIREACKAILTELRLLEQALPSPAAKVVEGETPEAAAKPAA